MTVLWHHDLAVRELKQQYGLTTFVETGCYEGKGLIYALGLGFEHLLSCDIVDRHAHWCRVYIPKAQTLTQDSEGFLKRILPSLDEPTLFWLDAHYPLYYGHSHDTKETKIPTLTELRMIRDTKPNFERDVIIVDDLRALEPKDNPFYVGRIEEYLMADGYYVTDFIDVFKDTHEYLLVYGETGNLIFRPKT